jgi:ribose transport system permease protein
MTLETPTDAAAEVESTGRAPRPRPSIDALGILERFALPLIVVALIVFFSVFSPTSAVFPTAVNWQNVLGNQTVVAIAAIAILLPLMCNQIDLSIGANIGVSAIMTAAAFEKWDAPLWQACLVGVLTGTVIGLINAIVIVRFNVPSLIATLGTTSLIQGYVSWYTSGQFIQKNIPESLTNFGSQLWLGVPRVTLAVVVLAALVYYIQQHTPFGRRLVSIGDNPTSARLIGLDVNRSMFAALLITGALAGLAGVLLLARSGAGNPQVGPGYTLQALSAAFLGATAIKPGRFNVVGTIIGVLLVAVTVNGLVLAGAADWVQPVFSGAALLASVGIAAYISRRRAGVA